MRLTFTLEDIDPLWIDGALPLERKKDRHVKVQLTGKSNAPFPPAFYPLGDLLCGERPSPLQHFVILLLTYPHSVTPAPAVQDSNGWWTVPGSTVMGQIRIPLPAEAIAKIRTVDADDHGYELTLEDVELTKA